MMTQPKRDKLTSNNKDTRWDRIRKRHGSHLITNLKSDVVRKFIEMDYIGRHQQDMLNGATDLGTSLDPVLVMNLRHAMFKKIPHKLPLATLAYSKNLQQCKDHNADVEEHYIQNQLNQFRKHLQKQHEQNNVSVKKLHSLLIDNTDIMKSLESTEKHIQDFYNAPIDALQEVHHLFSEQPEEHINLIDENSIECNTAGNEIKNHWKTFEDIDIDLEDQEKGDNELQRALKTKEDTNLKAVENENTLDFMAERESEFILSNEKFDRESQSENFDQRTPSPLENTEEVLQPLRKAIEDRTSLHLRYVRFDDDINICHLKKEDSICSNTSDGIDSVISDIAEEALKELQMEDEENIAKMLENNGLEIINNNQKLTRNECSYHKDEEIHNLHVTGKVVPHVKPSLKKHVEITRSSSSSEETDNYSNTEQSKIIENLFQTNVRNKISIMRKYFLKWVHYTTIEKIEREHVDVRADRVKKINVFLNKIRIEKNRLKNGPKTTNDPGIIKDQEKKDTMGNMKINKKYQNKIKIQQDIIDLQRLKLERQERIIMELKLHKLSEEAREERQDLKNELKSVIRSGDPKSKAKAKCLQLIGNLKDEEDDNLNKLEGKSLLMPKFLQNMQERALERSIRHEQAKQRRLQQESEREAQKLALEEAKRLEDEETKRMRIEALRERRRQEKLAKIIKERDRQKYIENQRKAQDFYKRLLLKRIGMEGFKRLLQRKKDNIKKCNELRRRLYMRTYFQAWFSLFRILKARRNQKADELYEKILKRKYIQIWLQYVYEERCKFNIAVDYNELKLTENMFRKWWTYSKRMQMIEETKLNQAISHHEWHLKWKVLDCWQRLPQILQLEKETEERRQRWRLKIWELLPDYTPHRDDFHYM